MSNSKLIERLNSKKTKSDVIRLDQLPTEVWYKVNGVSSEFQTKFGVSYILELENLETGERTKSFSTSRLPNRKFKDNTQNHYIQSLGLKPKKDGDEHFYDFVYIAEPTGVE